MKALFSPRDVGSARYFVIPPFAEMKEYWIHYGGFAISPCDLPKGISWEGCEVVQDRLDYSQLRRWIPNCVNRHKGACHVGPYDLEHAMPELFVIDCKSRDIIKAPPDAEYGALSYLWGSPGRGDEAEKPQSRSMRDMAASLIVEDAMVVVLNLGMRYL